MYLVFYVPTIDSSPNSLTDLPRSPRHSHWVTKWCCFFFLKPPLLEPSNPSSVWFGLLPLGRPYPPCLTFLYTGLLWWPPSSLIFCLCFTLLLWWRYSFRNVSWKPTRAVAYLNMSLFALHIWPDTEFWDGSTLLQCILGSGVRIEKSDVLPISSCVCDPFFFFLTLLWKCLSPLFILGVLKFQGDISRCASFFSFSMFDLLISPLHLGFHTLVLEILAGFVICNFPPCLLFLIEISIRDYWTSLGNTLIFLLFLFFISSYCLLSTS